MNYKTFRDILGYYQSCDNANLKEYFDRFTLDHESLNVLNLGVADGSLTSQLGNRTSPVSRRQREHLQGLGVLRVTGKEQLVGLVMPLYDERENVVNLFSFSYQSNPTNRFYINNSGHIRIDGSSEAIIVDDPMDLLPLVGCGYTLIFNTGDSYQHLLKGIEKVYVSSKKETINIPQYHIANGEPLFTLLRLEQAKFDLSKIIDEAKPLFKDEIQDVPVLEQDGFYYKASIGLRDYRVSGLEKNSSLDVLRVNIRVSCDYSMFTDSMDLLKQSDRRRFIDNCHNETAISKEVLKKDIGLLTLALEDEQNQRLQEPEKEEGYLMSDEERDEAMEVLQSPDLITQIEEAYSYANVVGEENNKISAYLAFTSRKLNSPLSLLIQSTSAAGKSTLMDAVLGFFPEEEVKQFSSMSGQSLYYMGENALKNKILSISEDEGVDQVVYALKVLQSEGCLRSAVTGKSPDKQRLVTNEYKVNGPLVLALTSTSSNLHEELVNRCLVVTVDESTEQTSKIHQAQRKARTIEGMVQLEQCKKIKVLMQNMQRLIAPKLIVNPYAEQLTFSNKATASRRHNPKYLTLIESITLLHQHQHQREVKEKIINGEHVEYIEVALEDIELANQLAPQLFGRSLDELTPQTRNFLNLSKELVRKKIEDGESPCFSKREFREFTDWSQRQIRRHVEKLIDYEYLTVATGGNGMSIEYQLLVDLDVDSEQVDVDIIDINTLKVG